MMSFSTHRLCFRNTLLLTMFVSSTAGCVNPLNTRFPELAPRAPELERRESQIHDPYPDERIGPTVGFRPLNFQQQRSEPQNAKDRFYTSVLRSPNRPSPALPNRPPLLAPPGASAPPGLPQQRMGTYPGWGWQPHERSQPHVVSPYPPPQFYPPPHYQ